MLAEFCKWLGGTPVSQVIQDVEWIIPVVQTIHILCLAVVLSSVAMVNARLLGVGGTRVSVAEMTQRFLPWIWWAVLLMACTGIILIAGEPPRSLRNTAFQLKMLLLATALTQTFLFQRSVRRNSVRHNRRTAAVSLALWGGVAIFGRLIAYMTPDS